MPAVSRKLHDSPTVLIKANFPATSSSTKGMILSATRRHWHSDPLIFSQCWNSAAEAKQSLSYTCRIWGRKCLRLPFNCMFSTFRMGYLENLRTKDVSCPGPLCWATNVHKGPSGPERMFLAAAELAGAAPLKKPWMYVLTKVMEGHIKGLSLSR